ncbi:uncharacterized protein LOC125856099 [Solanum stenotomum]|uniref:uncharacterized protein LOC125856099 n=1 Tax=Solanum stenotomum TaxID=172797 RepID=UPI0020D07537|nr:uncharacterized protein LOC125856099 [Solanum stenotomum]
MVTKKRAVSFKDDDRLQHCSAISTMSLVQTKADPNAFTIPCTIGLLHLAKALCYLGASINLMLLFIYQRLGLGDPKPTAMRLLMANRIVKRPICVLHDLLMKVELFIFPATKQSSEIQSVSAITYRVENGSEVQIEERLGVEALAAVMMNFESDDIEEYDELDATVDRCEYRSKPKKLELDMKNRESPPARPSVEEAPKLELKALPLHLSYVFLGREDTLPIIIAADLNGRQVEALCVPKKGGITVVPNERNVLVPMRPVTGWRIALVSGQTHIQMDRAIFAQKSALPWRG